MSRSIEHCLIVQQSAGEHKKVLLGVLDSLLDVLGYLTSADAPPKRVRR